MYCTAWRSTSSTTYKLVLAILMVTLLLSLVGTTVFDLADKQARYEITGAETITIDPSNVELSSGSVLSIMIIDTKYNMAEINITKTSSYAITILTYYDNETIAGKHLIIIAGNKIQVGIRSYMHNLNMTRIVLIINLYGSGNGKLKLLVKFHDQGGSLNIGTYSFGAPNPLSAISDFFSFLGIVWNGLIIFFDLVKTVFNMIWSIIVFVFSYLNIVIVIAEKYVLPNLALFMGIYFFTTLGMAIASMPKKGLEALIDWGRLWYGHIMALVNFIRMLANWAYKLINIIIKLIDAITPFT